MKRAPRLYGMKTIDKADADADADENVDKEADTDADAKMERNADVDGDEDDGDDADDDAVAGNRAQKEPSQAIIADADAVENVDDEENTDADAKA